MKTNVNENISRKEFLTGVGRIILLLLLIFIPLGLASRKKVAVKDEDCDIDLPCKSCNKYVDCNLKKEN